MRFAAPTPVRRQAAQLKRDLKAGRCSLGKLMSDPPAFVQTAKVADFLLALPKYGPVNLRTPLFSPTVVVEAQLLALRRRS